MTFLMNILKVPMKPHCVNAAILNLGGSGVSAADFWAKKLNYLENR